jgi:nicotinate-nucleotide adenylyltransferase
VATTEAATRAPRLGILGGTFNPIHCGHLDLARVARDALQLDEVWLVPSHVPPHKPGVPLASAFHRFAMVALAANAADTPWLIACDIELAQDGPSFTARTLERVASERQQVREVFFIVGTDAFAEIATWRDYPVFLDLAHFVVISRPGIAASSMARRLPALAARMIPLTTPGEIPPQPSILLVDAVTADVSSTEVRRRVAAGLSLEGRVPAAVERHAIRHGLYRA